MTDRLRSNGYRVPRRIAKGRMQRPHPVTQRREDAERYKAWVDGGGLKRLSDMFKAVYAGHIVEMLPR